MPGKNQSRRSEEHTSELQSPCNLVCRLLLEKKKHNNKKIIRKHNLTLAPENQICEPTDCALLFSPPPAVSCLCSFLSILFFFFFFFNDTATTEIYTLSLHDALPILHHGLLGGPDVRTQRPY